MKVTLVHATPSAAEILIFTKNTRLNMGPKLLEEIFDWSHEKKMAELKYMSRTLPSSWEFVDLIFCIEDVTRAFTHQLVRTRTASYAQQAMRVVPMKAFGYTTGPSIRDPAQKALYDSLMHTIQYGYDTLIENEVQPEDARGVLPTNIHTNIVAKYNLRTFAELVRKRSSGRVQSEYAECLQLMIKEVLEVWPWASDFINDPKQQALDKLTEYFKQEMADEVDIKGIQLTETNAWEMLKELDLIRDML